MDFNGVYNLASLLTNIPIRIKITEGNKWWKYIPNVMMNTDIVLSLSVLQMRDQGSFSAYEYPRMNWVSGYPTTELGDKSSSEPREIDGIFILILKWVCFKLIIKMAASMLPSHRFSIIVQDINIRFDSRSVFNWSSPKSWYMRKDLRPLEGPDKIHGKEVCLWSH